MKLADLRRISIKKNVRIRFSLPNGLECVLNEQGIARIPALHSVPDFNLEEELARVNDFTLEAVAAGDRPRDRQKPTTLTREQLAALAGAGPGETGHDHEE